jgi:hypothetical protein
MNEQNLDTCVCGHKIKGLNDHNIKKHPEHCIPYKDANSQPKITFMNFFKNIGTKKQHIKEKPIERCLPTPQKQPSELIGNFINENDEFQSNF